MEDSYQAPTESQLDPLTKLVLSLQQRAAQMQPGVVTGLRKFLFGTHPIEGSPHPGMFDFAPGVKPLALGLASIPGVAGRLARYAGRPGVAQSGRARVPGIESATEEYIQGPGIMAMDEALGLRNPYAYAPTNPKDPLGEVAKQQAGNYLAERLKQLKEQYAKARQEANTQGAVPSLERQLTAGQPRDLAMDRLVSESIRVNEEYYNSPRVRASSLRFRVGDRDPWGNVLSDDDVARLNQPGVPARRTVSEARQREFFRQLVAHTADRSLESLGATDWRPMLVRYNELRRNRMSPEDAFRNAAAEWEAARRARLSTSFP